MLASWPMSWAIRGLYLREGDDLSGKVGKRGLTEAMLIRRARLEAYVTWSGNARSSTRVLTSPDGRLSSSGQVFAPRRAPESPARSARQPTRNDSSPCARCSPSQAGSRRSQPLVGRAWSGNPPPVQKRVILQIGCLRMCSFISFRLTCSLSISSPSLSL